MDTRQEPDAEALESRIRDYFAACNAGDAKRIASHFERDAKHYFPRGVPQGTMIGALGIGEGWAKFVREFGSHWSVDHVLVNAAKREAVIEWTHTKRNVGLYLRGDEWYRFSEHGLIAEIRAYYACPAPDASRSHELGDYPYAELSYPFH
ncbi:MAG: nuclear transport factor 2 family protein [Gemmatimonadaceae bacterium]